MASMCKMVCATALIFIIIVATITSAPVPEHHQKIRIHIPVKHHTHLITKTLVKTVHVPVPIKEHHHHVIEEDKEEEELEEEPDWSYIKKKKFHPFY